MNTNTPNTETLNNMTPKLIAEYILIGKFPREMLKSLSFQQRRCVSQVERKGHVIIRLFFLLLDHGKRPARAGADKVSLQSIIQVDLIRWIYK